MGNKLLTKHDNNLNYFNENYPKKIRYLKDLTTDSYARRSCDKTFIVFNSINDDILYLIYYTQDNLIISYNLITFQKINEIKNVNQEIVNFNYYCDKNNKRDLILSISIKDIILWNVKNWECMAKIQMLGDNLFACFINDNNNIYIFSIISNYKYSKSKLFYLYGEEIKDLYEYKEKTTFVDTYYDKNLNKNYIIAAHFKYVDSYDYTNNKIYHRYYEKSDNIRYDIYHIVFKENNNIIKMIESESQYIRIWDFHKGKLLNKINTNDYWFRGICIWNDDYFITACSNKKFILAELNGKIPSNLNKNYRYIEINNTHDAFNIKKIFHPKLGECLITQGNKNEQIKIWVNN